jgi:hypothetical protein
MAEKKSPWPPNGISSQSSMAQSLPQQLSQDKDSRNFTLAGMSVIFSSAGVGRLLNYGGKELPWRTITMMQETIATLRRRQRSD